MRASQSPIVYINVCMIPTCTDAGEPWKTLLTADNAIRQMLCPHYMFRAHSRSHRTTSDVHRGHWFWTWETYAHDFHYASTSHSEALKRTHLNPWKLDLKQPRTGGIPIITICPLATILQLFGLGFDVQGHW